MEFNIGKIELTNMAIMDIVLESVKECEGVISLAQRNSKIEGINIIKNITKIGMSYDLDVELGETECVVFVGLVLKYGLNVVEVVKNFQNILKDNIERLTNIKVNEINVKIINVKKEEGNENV